jgi:anti-sigma factor ChrR (cupin superfamily)
MDQQGPRVFHDLARRAADPDFAWTPLRPRVDVHHLYQLEGGPAAALLRYAPGGRIPAHVHEGHEHIYILSGSQQDGRGVYVAGDLVVNAPGTSHEVESPGGCMVFVIWERPVRFVDS